MLEKFTPIIVGSSLPPLVDGSINLRMKDDLSFGQCEELPDGRFEVSSLPPAPSQDQFLEEQMRLRETLNPLAIAQRFKHAMATLEQSGLLVGRRELFQQTALTLACREHQLLLGDPGLAKTLYAETIFSLFRDAYVYKQQLAKATTRDAIVGPLNISRLKQGEYVHNVTGTVIDADFAFFDELFNANDHTLLSLNSILHERKFSNGTQQVVAKLRSALSTSNLMRYSRQTDAVIDRFIAVSYLSPLQCPLERTLMARSFNANGGKPRIPEVVGKIPLAEFDFVCDVIAHGDSGYQVAVPDHLFYLQEVILSRYLSKVGVGDKDNDLHSKISDRTKAKAMRFAKAAALMNGRLEVGDQDLAALSYVIPPIGHPNHYTETYARIAQEVTREFKRTDRKLIDELLALSDDIGAVENEIRTGKRTLDPTLVERVKLFCRLTSPGQITFSDVAEAIKRKEPTHVAVHELRDLIGQKLALAMKRVNKNNTDPLL